MAAEISAPQGDGGAGGPATRAGTALRRAAGAGMYRTNPFRVTGVATDAESRTVRERAKRAATLVSAGRTPATDGDLPLPDPATPDEVLAAFDALRDPPRRLAAELAWLWDTEAPACSCPEAVHQRHDAAVRAHAVALDLERRAPDAAARTERSRRWLHARLAWTEVLDDDAVWEHVRRRVAAADARELEATTAADLRRTLPAALLVPAVELAFGATAADIERLMAIVRAWPVDDESRATVHEELFGPRLARVESQVHEHGDPASRWTRSRLSTLRGLVADVDALSALDLDAGSFRMTRLRGQLAILLNNGALALADATGQGGATNDEIRRALEEAVRLAEDSGRADIAENLEGWRERERVDGLLAPYRLHSDEDGVEELMDRATRALTSGRHTEGRAMMATLREILTDPASRAQIDLLLSSLDAPMPKPSPRPAAPPPPRQAAPRSSASPSNRYLDNGLLAEFLADLPDEQVRALATSTSIDDQIADAAWVELARRSGSRSRPAPSSSRPVTARPPSPPSRPAASRPTPSHPAPSRPTPSYARPPYRRRRSPAVRLTVALVVWMLGLVGLFVLVAGTWGTGAAVGLSALWSVLVLVVTRLAGR